MLNHLFTGFASGLGLSKISIIDPTKTLWFRASIFAIFWYFRKSGKADFMRFLGTPSPHSVPNLWANFSA
jgi:hypothetical protein